MFERDRLEVPGRTVDDVLLRLYGSHQHRGHRDAELMVGTRHRSAVGKFLLGSTAQRILLEAGCPVLVVKPEGSPPR